MNKKVIIAGSGSLRKKGIERKNWRENKGYEVLNYPKNLEGENIHNEYKELYTNFFRDLIKADIFFLMNEDKKGIEGYIGMESFAELGFAVVQKTVQNKAIDILFLKIPAKEVGCYDEIKIRKELGRIKLIEDTKLTLT